MIYLNSDSLNAQLGALVKVFDRFPKSIAKKHIGAAMKRALKFAIPILKANTPKGGSTGKQAAMKRDARGHFIKGSGAIRKTRGGALRKAATAQSRFIGKNRSGFTIGTLGYKYGAESRKAIWQEFGTKKGIEPKLFMQKTYDQVKDQIAGQLARELALALEAAAREQAPFVEGSYRRK